jgi:hypothetical protein
MRISAEGLHLELEARRRVDDEDWVRVGVAVSVVGFDGNFEAWLQLGDLRRFCEQIELMYDSVGRPGKARLASAEPEIDIGLEMETLGGIRGAYRFESEHRRAAPTVLSGSFEMDQSHLPALAESIRELVVELGPSNAA